MSENTLFKTHPWLKLWWDNEKNKDYVKDISKSSREIVFWKCPYCGHSWKEEINERVRKKTCPFCRGRIRNYEIEHQTRFLDIFPAAKQEFIAEKNEGISLEDLYMTDENIIVWSCRTCGGMWRSSINDRVVLNPDGTYTLLPCKKCMGRQGSLCLAKKHPQVALSFDEEKNGIYREEMQTKETYWWTCIVCGKSYISRAENVMIRNKYSGYCQACRHSPTDSDESFAALYPDKMQEFATENTIDPKKVKSSCMTSVLWRCTKNPSHVWKARFWDRTHGCFDSCPFCKMEQKGQRSVKDEAPGLEELFDEERNCREFWFYTLTSSRPVWWKCDKGHKLHMSAKRMLQLSSKDNGTCHCPICTGKLPMYLNEYNKEVIKEWAFVENMLLGMIPETTPINSRKLVWWKCSKCGNYYTMSVGLKLEYIDRNQTTCPKCKGIQRIKIHYF